MAVHFVFDAMGTTVSVASATRLQDSVRSEVRGIFNAYDAPLSLYRSGSEASAVACSAFDLAYASEQLWTVHDLAWNWSVPAHGAFTPRRPDGVLDLAGVVKAVAVQAAAEAVRHPVLQLMNASGPATVKVDIETLSAGEAVTALTTLLED